MKTARNISSWAIPVALVIAISMFSAWGWGSILAGIGAYFIITYISFMLSGGKNLDEPEYPQSNEIINCPKSSDSPIPEGIICQTIAENLITHVDFEKHADFFSTLNVKNPQNAMMENLYLEIFARDFATYQYFGETPIKDQILASYYSGLEKKGIDLDTVGKRNMVYAKVLKAPPSNEDFGKPFDIGK